jgi:Reversibly glycosylated polypeptide.
MQDVCVVVPTIREFECVRDYVANAREHGFDTDRLHVVLVTEDHCPTEEMREMLRDLGVEGAVFDGRARSAWLADRDVAAYDHLIPARSHAQTSFGLLYLWAEGFDYGVFLDDDTRPHEGRDFFGRHLANLGPTAGLETRTSDERWVNVLEDVPYDLYPRGYPYAAMDETETRRRSDEADVVASQGLWTDVPDLDAARILADGDLRGQSTVRLSADDYGDDFLVAPGDYLTVCSMNLAFRREVVPAFYQFPMDDNEWGVGRFDDIWSGVLLKRACDVLGRGVRSGAPLCHHHKAPRSTFDDLAAETAALELNEHLWRVVDDAGDDAETFADVARAAAGALVEAGDEDWRNAAFLAQCGEYLADWVDCLDHLAPARAGADRQI